MYAFDIEDIDPSEKTRLVSTSSGVTYEVIQTDPYGFWTMRAMSGVTPKELGGQFTTFEQAKKQIKEYVNKINEKIVKVVRPNEEVNEPGATPDDIYNPPVLQRKQKIKRVHDTISLG